MSVFILEKVTKKFKVDKKEICVLRDINLSFPDTGLVSIVGKSGCGKSTLLNLLMGIEKPTEGRIIFKEKDISKFRDRKFSLYHLGNLSMVFQHYNLFDNLTAFDNVALPAKMAGVKKRKYSKKVKELFNDLNISYLLKRNTKTLSGGEKQRVAIARALIIEPSVILCDEPTGALDSENSHEIMEILKKYSRKILIIMVSHNKELVRKYSDKIIKLKDGKIVSKEQDEHNETVNAKLKKNKYTSNWIAKFILKNLKTNFAKNAFSLVACVIGFTAMFLCSGFLLGSKSSQQEALNKNLSIGYATVSSVENFEIEDSPLTYQKTVRPELSEIDCALSDLNTIRVEENFSYFLSNSSSCKYDSKTYSEFEMVPVYDLSLKNYGSDLLIKGSCGSDNFEEVLVNEEFIKMIGNIGINSEIIFTNNSSTSFNTYDKDNPFIKDELNIEKPMKIIGILREFPFLNTPKIYYSYKGAKNYLRAQYMENLSNYKGKFVSFYDYIEEADNDNEVTSYSSLIFLTDLTECEKFFSKIEQLKSTSSLEITSQAFEIKNTYEFFISSFSKTLIVFVGIAFIGINLILGMISLSTYIDNKKNTAILTCLGARNSSIYKIYLIEDYLLIGFSVLLSLLFSKKIEGLLNPIISNKFALSNLIKIPFESFIGIPYGLIIILVIISILFSTVFSVIPMSIYRNAFISDELRDE